MKISKHLYALAIAGAAFSAQAQTTWNYTADFDGTFNSTLTTPIIATATFSYSAASQLPDGIYSWTSFTSLAFSVTLGGVTFTQANLDNPVPSAINVHLVGSNFYFSNTGTYGNRRGSADFLNGGDYLTTQPISSTTPTTTPRYQSSLGNGTYGFNATPVPEASGSVAGLGLAMAGLYQLRRRKAAGKVVEG